MADFEESERVNRRQAAAIYGIKHPLFAFLARVACKQSGEIILAIQEYEALIIHFVRMGIGLR